MKTTFIILLFFNFQPSLSAKTTYTLKNYLEDVSTKNQTVKASHLIIESLKNRNDEGQLLFRPQIFAFAQNLTDKRPTTNIAAQGDETDNTTNSVGIMNQFNFGLKSKLSYSLSHTHIFNAQPTFLPRPEFNDSQIQLELTQPLYRNALGSEAHAQNELMNADLNMKISLEEFKTINILSSAETVYWSLATLLKMQIIQKENLDRALKLKSWASSRAHTGLGDTTDLLQSDSNVKFREYELKTTEQQIKNLTLQFNSLLNQTENELQVELERPTNAHLQNLKISPKNSNRLDTKAALELKKATKANLDLSIERNKPTFELFLNYALNGRDLNTTTAISNGFKTDHNTQSMGVRFSAPLDFDITKRARDSYAEEKAIADINFEQKKFDEEKEWMDLQSKFEDAKKNLEMVQQIELAQKEKLAHEKDRLSKGRTTTFQVLNFEQDYAQAELLKVKTELELLSLYAQSKTFTTLGAGDRK